MLALADQANACVTLGSPTDADARHRLVANGVARLDRYGVSKGVVRTNMPALPDHA